MTTQTTTDTDFRRLVLVSRILRGIRDVASLAQSLERDREELLTIADAQPQERREVSRG